MLELTKSNLKLQYENIVETALNQTRNYDKMTYLKLMGLEQSITDVF